jgi:hypothetical protein
MIKRRELLIRSLAALGGLVATRSSFADAAPCPPILGEASTDELSCKTKFLSQAAGALSPGQSVDFVAGRNPLTRHNPEISWQEITLYYDAKRKEAQYMGKPQSGVSLDYSHYIFDEARNSWRTTGQNLFPGLGHVWVSTWDPDSGDYFFHRYGENGLRWFRRQTEAWTETKSQPGFLGRSMNTINGMAYSPELFGAGDGGIVCQSIDDVWAWRRANDSWTHLASGAYGKNGTGLYMPGPGIAVIGSGTFQDQPGDLYLVKNGSSVPGSGLITNVGRPPIIIGGAGGGSGRGKLLVDPANPERLLILEYLGSSRVWSSVDYGRNWKQEDFEHPFNDLTGASFNGFTAAAISPYKVIWGLSSSTNPEGNTSRLWKPNA